MAINAAGAVCTGVTLVVVLVSKFLEGAWVMCLLVPALLFLFYEVRIHYREDRPRAGDRRAARCRRPGTAGRFAADAGLECDHAQGTAIRPEDLARDLRAAYRG